MGPVRRLADQDESCIADRLEERAHAISRGLEEGPAIPVVALASFELSLLLARDLLDHVVGDPAPGHNVVVQNADTAGSDSAHRQLGIARKAELSDHEYVKRRLERSSYLVCHGYAAAGQGQYHDVASALEPVETRRELNSCVPAISIRLSFGLIWIHVDLSRLSRVSRASKMPAPGPALTRPGTDLQTAFERSADQHVREDACRSHASRAHRARTQAE